MLFDEPVKPIRRHWRCEKPGCGGEFISAGEGFTQLTTEWKHVCDRCGAEEWAPERYPTIVWVPE